MSNVNVTVSIPQEEKDAVDAIIVAINDVKANKGQSLLVDELPLAMKLGGELAALKADLTLKGSLVALSYLSAQLEGAAS